MSDWTSVYSAVGAANAGLDLEMPKGRFMNAVQKIVAVNYGTHIRFLYGLAESRKINFMQSTLVYVRAGMMTAPFLIVGDKVLDGGNDSFRLHAQDILFGSLAC